MKVWKVLLASLLALGACARVQAQTQAEAAVQPAGQSPAFRGNVVSGLTQAVNYGHLDNSTKTDLKRTGVMLNAADEAKVQSKIDAIKIAADFEWLQRSTTFGNEYLTYVMWPISPEGRPVNLDEISVDNIRRSKLDQTDESLDLRSPMQEVKTLFATQSRVLFVQFWGGRIQISEIGGTLNMQNVILGPSGSDGLLDYHPPRRNEPDLPRSITFNGFSVRFQLGRNVRTERRAEVWRCLAWIGGAGRRCRF